MLLVHRDLLVGLPFGIQAGKSPAAGCVHGTIADHLLHGLLQAGGKVHADHCFQGNDAIQQDAAHAVRMLPQHQLRHARAIGNTHEVDLRVTEGLAHEFHIFHAQAGGEETYIRRQVFQAFPGFLYQQVIVCGQRQRLVLRAIQRC